MTRRRTAFIIACAVLAALGPVRAADEHGVTLQTNVPVKMRDGVTLYADVYRPKDDGKYPVLLQRTPYNKDGDREFGLRAAARGYVVIIQDVRGRYASEGEWYTFKHEPDDGYDTVEWAGALPYSDGKVGMFGGSYVGATQMLAAIAHPPHLAGICPVVTASNYHSNWTYQGGAFSQWFNQSWTSGLAQDTIARNTRGRSNALKGMTQLPLGNFPLFNPPADGRPPEATATLAQYYLDWIAHPAEDGYWKQWSIEGHFSDITVPALHIVAWYDLFQDGSFRNYIGIKAHGANEAARNGQRLITVVGGHAGNGPIIGDVDFGPDSKFDEDGATLDWYDYLFKGAKNQFAGKPVKLFVMGANQWRDEDDWPLARARNTKYFLHSDGKANSLRGSGTLSTTAPAAETADRIRLRSGEPGADGRRAALLRRRPPEAWPARSAPCRSTRRRPRVFDAAAGSRHGSHRARDARAVCEVVRGGYRLHGQARGRQTRRLCPEHDRRHPSGALPRLAGEAVAHHTRAGLQDDGGALVHEQRVQERPRASPGGLEQQLPAVRSQSQHGRGERHGHTLRVGDQQRPARRAAPVGAGVAGCALTDRT